MGSKERKLIVYLLFDNQRQKLIDKIKEEFSGLSCEIVCLGENECAQYLPKYLSFLQRKVFDANCGNVVNSIQNQIKRIHKHKEDKSYIQDYIIVTPFIGGKPTKKHWHTGFVLITKKKVICIERLVNLQKLIEECCPSDQELQSLRLEYGSVKETWEKKNYGEIKFHDLVEKYKKQMESYKPGTSYNKNSDGSKSELTKKQKEERNNKMKKRITIQNNYSKKILNEYINDDIMLELFRCINLSNLDSKHEYVSSK